MNKLQALSDFIETRSRALNRWTTLILEHENNGTVCCWRSYETIRLIRGELLRQLNLASAGKIPRSKLPPLLAQLEIEQTAQEIA